MQLAAGRRFWILALVDQTGGEFDADGLDRGSVLEDERDGRLARRVSQEGDDRDGVDSALRGRLARGHLPHAVFAVLVGPVNLSQLEPLGGATRS